MDVGKGWRRLELCARESTETVESEREIRMS